LTDKAKRLPVLKRLNEDRKQLALINYQLNQTNANSLTEAIKTLVPRQLRKLILIDNALNDQQVAGIFRSLILGKTGGLYTLVFMQN